MAQRATSTTLAGFVVNLALLNAGAYDMLSVGRALLCRCMCWRARRRFNQLEMQWSTPEKYLLQYPRDISCKQRFRAKSALCFLFQESNLLPPPGLVKREFRAHFSNSKKQEFLRNLKYQAAISSLKYETCQPAQLRALPLLTHSWFVRVPSPSPYRVRFWRCNPRRTRNL